MAQELQLWMDDCQEKPKRPDSIIVAVRKSFFGKDFAEIEATAPEGALDTQIEIVSND